MCNMHDIGKWIEAFFASFYSKNFLMGTGLFNEIKLSRGTNKNSFYFGKVSVTKEVWSFLDKKLDNQSFRHNYYVFLTILDKILSARQNATSKSRWYYTIKFCGHPTSFPSFHEAIVFIIDTPLTIGLPCITYTLRYTVWFSAIFIINHLQWLSLHFTENHWNQACVLYELNLLLL